MTRIYIISVTFVQMDMFSTMSFDYILLVAGLALFSRIISRPKFKHMNPITLSNILSWNSGLRSILSLIVLYLPPSSDVPLFFDEFASYLAYIVMASGYLLIVGDFNFHVDSQNNAGRRFTGLLHLFNLRQRVNDSTNKNSHTLDLIITREEQSFIKNLWSLILHFLIILRSGVIWIFVNILLKIKCYLFDV